jgi:MFS family permease
VHGRGARRNLGEPAAAGGFEAGAQGWQRLGPAGATINLTIYANAGAHDGNRYAESNTSLDGGSIYRIWLPQHGYDFTQTPLWAGIYMLPLTAGMLIAGPTSGYLSDHFGARPFATGGMVGAALSFGLLWLLPIDFSYPVFALVLLCTGLSMGMFASPNRAAVMNSLPPGDRGAGGGMNQTFQNSAQVLSVGIFFSLMIAGLGSALPHTLAAGLQAHGVGASAAARVAHTPPVEVLFAAFLGYNPVGHLAGAHVLAGLAPHARAVLTGRTFFPI